MNGATAYDASMNRADVHDTLRERLRGDDLDWIVPDWDVPSNVAAFMTTRNGGAGREGAFDVGGADMPVERARIVAAHRRHIEAYLPARPHWLTQIHGADVVEIDADPPGRAPRADAAVTRRANVVLTVRVADCMPVLFATHDGGVVGIAHAGWRGLANGVLERTLQSMRCDARDVCAWLGPAIGASAFEVGADGQSEAPVQLHDYGFKVAYREAILRRWLIMEVRTSLDWPRDFIYQHRSASFGIGLGFEMMIGTEEFLARPVTF